MAKRNRVDGVEGQKEIMAGVMSLLAIPDHIKLTSDQEKIWHKYSKSKALRSWRDSDLDLLADLVRSVTRVERYSQELEYADIEERKQLEKDVDTLVKRQRMLTNHLQIHPAATHGKSREQVSQNQAHAEAMGQIGDCAHDPLLAKPH